jgi:histidinol-phosphate aminotransferase
VSPFPRPAYRALEPYRPDRRPVPVDLSDNTNLRGPNPAALEAIRSSKPEDLARYPSVYADALLDAVVDRFGVPREAVTTGCGSDDILDSLFRAVAEPGDRVTYLDPTFSMVPIFGHVNGAVPRPVAGIPLPRPADLLESDPALVYLCSPNNPSGEMLPEGWLAELRAAASARPDGGPVIVMDEAYADYGASDWLARAPGMPRFLVARTLSKAYGLAGVRVGFAVGDPEVIAELEKSRGPYKVTRVGERAAVAALADESGWVRSGVEEVLEARGRLVAELQKRGLSPRPSQANFVLVPVGDTAGVTSSLRAQGVAVRPFPGVTGVGDCIRVSVGRWDYMERFLEALDQVPGSDLCPAPGGPTPADPAGGGPS